MYCLCASLELERSFKETRRFTANAAHELQTPLTILRGHIDVALRRPRTTEAYQDTLRLLGTEIDGQIQMVRALLMLARLDRTYHRNQRQLINLTDLVCTEADRYRTLAETKGLVFELDTKAALQVSGHGDLLREVVANLLDNAIKYTSDGEVTVRLEAVGDQVRLIVQDTGIGMDSEIQAQVTDRFYRATSVQQHGIPGSGLGLSIVSQIVALHEGQVQIDSTPGVGTTVQVLLSRS
jgi:signal transduction histidine kinase